MERDVDFLLLAYHRDGDREARDRALVELMPLVRALASRYAGRGEPLEDLVQVGALGLIKAVDRFDVDRGVQFSSYAVPTIVGEIRRHFRDKAWAMPSCPLREGCDRDWAAAAWRRLCRRPTGSPGA